MDPFCIFYLHFIKGKESLADNFWSVGSPSGEIVSWRGLAFENVCFNHISRIKEALGIPGVRTNVSAWSIKGNNSRKGVQIDLLLDRGDNIVNLCEIKYYGGSYQVKKDDYLQMLERQKRAEEEFPKRKAVRNTLITTFGLVKNEYSNVFSNVITLEDLF